MVFGGYDSILERSADEVLHTALRFYRRFSLLFGNVQSIRGVVGVGFEASPLADCSVNALDLGLVVLMDAASAVLKVYWPQKPVVVL
jgi:hypothetical protein